MLRYRGADGPRPGANHLHEPADAAVGLIDEQKNERGIECSLPQLPLEYLPRALVERDARGLVELVVERSLRRILGATAVAEGAGDVVLAGVYSVQFGLTVDLS